MRTLSIKTHPQVGFELPAGEAGQINTRMRQHLFISALILLIVLSLGWKLTDHIEDTYRTTLQQHVAEDLDMLSGMLETDMASLAGTAHALALSPSTSPALENHSLRNRRRADEAVDRYHLAAGASIAYLMDRDGNVVAASNRDKPDSLMGKNYRFRPYFTEALAGNPSRYFALGVTTGKRGAYAGHPVRDRRGEILGVAVVKKNLDAFEHHLHGIHQYAFLIDPNGIAFLSGHPAMRMRSPWPTPDASREAMSRSQQFGAIDIAPLGQEELQDGAWVTLEGERYRVGRRPVGGGWSFVLLRTEPAIALSRRLGLAITLMLGILVLVYYAVIRRELAGEARLLEQQQELEKLSAALEVQASTDSLTGVSNRARFSETLAAEMERAQRYKTPFCLAMYDIDHFKRINDAHGHPAGDDVLVSLSELVASNIRANDRLSRWGGEEFMILTPNSDLDDGVDLAERTRKAIEQHDFGAAGRVTCSFGVAEYRPGDTEESITGRADAALYRAKSLGRNRVEREAGS